MELLKEMFPQHEEAVIQAILDDAGGDIEQASILLLSPGLDTSVYRRPVAPPPSNPIPPPEAPKKRFEDGWTRSSRRSIGEALGKWFEDGIRADVALVCNDGIVVPAHKLILTVRNQILGVMLMTVQEEGVEDVNWAELKSKQPLTVDSIPASMPRLDMDMSSQVCRKVLKYLYTDVLEEIEVEEIPAMHEAALSLDIEFIKRKCEGADKYPPRTYGEDFMGLLESEEHAYSDLELVSEEGGEVWHVHKLLMSCVSEYFAEMLGGRFVEGQERRLVMKGVSEAELKLMVESVYADGRVRKESVDERNAFQVFLKSNQFLFRALQAHAESVMTRFLDEDNVLVLLGDEIVRTSPTMKRSCLEFISKRYEAMQHLDGYTQLPTLLKLEVEHYAAKRNEEMFTALIATMTDGINISDFNSLVQDEISEFLDSQLSNIHIGDLQDAVNFDLDAQLTHLEREQNRQESSPPEPESPGAPTPANTAAKATRNQLKAKSLLIPTPNHAIQYSFKNIKLAPTPSEAALRNPKLRHQHRVHGTKLPTAAFDDAAKLIGTVASVANSSSTAHSSVLTSSDPSTDALAVPSTSSAGSEVEGAVTQQKTKRRKRGAFGEFARRDALRQRNEEAIRARRAQLAERNEARARRAEELAAMLSARAEFARVMARLGGNGGNGNGENGEEAGAGAGARENVVDLSSSLSSSSSEESSSDGEIARPLDPHAAMVNIAGAAEVRGAGNEERLADEIVRLLVLPDTDMDSHSDSEDVEEQRNDYPEEEAEEDTEEEDTEEDWDSDSFSSSDSPYSSDSDSDSDSSSSESSSSEDDGPAFFTKDSVSAVFTPTKLSILASDLSFMIQESEFRLESIPIVDHEEAWQARPEKTDDTAIDIGTADILISGVSFALSFSFSFPNNPLMQDLSKLASKKLAKSARRRSGSDFDPNPNPFDLSSSSSDDDSSSSSSDDELNAALRASDLGANAGSHPEVPVLSLSNFTCDLDHLKFRFRPSHLDLKRMAASVSAATATSSAAPKAEPPKLTVFSRPKKFGAVEPPIGMGLGPAAPPSLVAQWEGLDAQDPAIAANSAPTLPSAAVPPPPSIAPTIRLPNRSHPLLWFPHYASTLKASLKGALVAALQTKIADSLARLTEHLNQMSIRQLSSLHERRNGPSSGGSGRGRNTGQSQYRYGWI